MDLFLHNPLLGKIIAAIIEMFGIFAVGGIARHFKYIEEKDLNNWSKLIIDFLLPLLTFGSIIRDLRIDMIKEVWILPVIGIGLMVLGALMGIVLMFGLKTKDYNMRITFHHFCAVNNYSFLPIIIISNVWGPSLLPLLFILNIGSTIGYWTIGIILLGNKDIKDTIKNVLSPNITSVIVALLIVFCGLQPYIPTIITKICFSLGNSAVPVLFVIIGASLYGAPRLMAHKWDITYLTLCRLIIIPIVSILILKLIPMSKDIYNISFIVSIMPVSVSSVLVVRVYGGNPEYAGQAALATTSASILTIPLILYFFSL